MHSASGVMKSAGFADTVPLVAHSLQWLNWSASILLGYASSLAVVAAHAGSTVEPGAHFAITRTIIDSPFLSSREKANCVSTTASPVADILRRITEVETSRCFLRTGLPF